MCGSQFAIVESDVGRLLRDSFLGMLTGGSDPRVQKSPIRKTPWKIGSGHPARKDCLSVITMANRVQGCISSKGGMLHLVGSGAKITCFGTPTAAPLSAADPPLRPRQPRGVFGTPRKRFRALSHPAAVIYCLPMKPDNYTKGVLTIIALVGTATVTRQELEATFA
jgi:hypothetical protein